MVENSIRDDNALHTIKQTASATSTREKKCPSHKQCSFINFIASSREIFAPLIHIQTLLSRSFFFIWVAAVFSPQRSTHSCWSEKSYKITCCSKLSHSNWLHRCWLSTLSLYLTMLYYPFLYIFFRSKCLEYFRNKSNVLLQSVNRLFFRLCFQKINFKSNLFSIQLL